MRLPSFTADQAVYRSFATYHVASSNMPLAAGAIPQQAALGGGGGFPKGVSCESDPTCPSGFRAFLSIGGQPRRLDCCTLDCITPCSCTCASDCSRHCTQTCITRHGGVSIGVVTRACN